MDIEVWGFLGKIDGGLFAARTIWNIRPGALLQPSKTLNSAGKPNMFEQMFRHIFPRFSKGFYGPGPEVFP